MASHLLDTSVIIDFLNGKRDRAALLRTLLQQGHTLGCCPTNVTEIYAGMHPKEKATTEFFLLSLEFYDVTWETAREAGLLKRDYARKGVTVSLADVTIAAVAIANGLTLVTDNAKHFPMKQLQLFSGLPRQ